MRSMLVVLVLSIGLIVPAAASAALTFGPVVPAPTGVSGFGAASGDFNGDGHEDLVMTGGNQVSEVAGAPMGLFGAPELHAVTGVGAITVGAVTVADLNRDGYDDAALTYYDDGA